VNRTPTAPPTPKGVVHVLRAFFNTQLPWNTSVPLQDVRYPLPEGREQVRFLREGRPPRQRWSFPKEAEGSRRKRRTPFLREEAKDALPSGGSRQRWSFPKDVQKKVASFGNLWRFLRKAARGEASRRTFRKRVLRRPRKANQLRRSATTCRAALPYWGGKASQLAQT